MLILLLYIKFYIMFICHMSPIAYHIHLEAVSSIHLFLFVSLSTWSYWFSHCCLPVSAVWDPLYLKADKSDIQGQQRAQYIYWKHFPCWCLCWIDCMEMADLLKPSRFHFPVFGDVLLRKHIDAQKGSIINIFMHERHIACHHHSRVKPGCSLFI